MSRQRRAVVWIPNVDPGDVFSFLTDVKGFAEWNRSIGTVLEAPSVLAPGTTWRSTRRRRLIASTTRSTVTSMCAERREISHRSVTENILQRTHIDWTWSVWRFRTLTFVAVAWRRDTPSAVPGRLVAPLVDRRLAMDVRTALNSLRESLLLQADSESGPEPEPTGLCDGHRRRNQHRLTGATRSSDGGADGGNPRKPPQLTLMRASGHEALPRARGSQASNVCIGTKEGSDDAR